MGSKCTSDIDIAEIIAEISGDILTQIVEDKAKEAIREFEERHYKASLYLKGDHMNIRISDNIEFSQLRYVQIKNKVGDSIKLTIKSVEIPSS